MNDNEQILTLHSDGAEHSFDSPEIVAITERIELKKLDVDTGSSSESLCFICDVYVDDLNIGIAKNHGRGDATIFHSDAANLGLVTILNNLGKLILVANEKEIVHWNMPVLISYIVSAMTEAKELEQWILRKSITHILIKTDEMSENEYAFYERKCKVSDKASCAAEERKFVQDTVANTPNLVGIYGLRSKKHLKGK